MLRFRSVTLLLAIALLCTPGCNKPGPTEEFGEEEPLDFVLADLDGASFQLSSTAGKVVLLHFFAPWCGACDSEAPILKEIHGLYSDRGFVIVAVAVNSSVDEARAFKERHGLPYRILIDNKVVAQLGYGITTIPTNFFINRDEKIGRPRGLLSRDDFMDIIESLL